jgi:hypothetical protein
MTKSTEQIQREIRLLTEGPRRVAHVGFGTYQSSKIDLPQHAYGEQRHPTRAQRSNPKLPAGETFSCMDRHGKVLGTSKTIQGAMEKAPAGSSYAKVKGEYTSDGHYWGPGAGRTIAVREGKRWQVG